MRQAKFKVTVAVKMASPFRVDLDIKLLEAHPTWTKSAFNLIQQEVIVKANNLVKKILYGIL